VRCAAACTVLAHPSDRALTACVARPDDNLRERFIKARRWPPQRATGMEGQGPVWFDHLEHEQAPQVPPNQPRPPAAGPGSCTRPAWTQGPPSPAQIMSTVENGTQRYAEGVVFSGEAANESMMDDLDSGLNTTSFCVSGVEAIEHLAVKVSMELYCNRAQSPWCLQAYDLQKN